jgi:recombination protein RecR
MSAFHNYPSKLLEQAVREFASLPGIGNKTALRLVLHLLKQDEEDVVNFGNAMIELKRNIHHCKICQNISDTDTCQICSNPNRGSDLICVVENIRDVMSIENTNQYSGLYHVLGGIISPIDGIGPSDLTINELEQRVKAGGINEVILALSTTMEGDTTNFYIYRKLKSYSVKVSTLARGVATGDELEYADEITLGRSIVNRTPYEATFADNKKGNPE